MKLSPEHWRKGYEIDINCEHCGNNIQCHNSELELVPSYVPGEITHGMVRGGMKVCAKCDNCGTLTYIGYINSKDFKNFGIL